jgi:hypothetical protein
VPMVQTTGSNAVRALIQIFAGRSLKMRSFSRAIALGLSCIFIMSSSQNVTALDMYNITKDTHIIVTSGEMLSTIFLGSGVILDDKWNPVPSPRSPFRSTQMTTSSVTQEAPLDVQTIVNSTSSFIEDNNNDEQSQALYANMRAAFSLGSIEAAY